MGAGNGGAVKASRVLLLARLASGGLLTVRPAQGLRLLGRGQDDAASRTVLRVLGARHLVQGAAEALRRDPGVLRAGAGIDVLHALTALGYATASRQGRSAGRRSAVLALSFAVAQLVVARRASTAAQEGSVAVLPPGAPTTQLAVLRGGAMDGAQVAVDVADLEYTVMAVEDAETGTQRYVRTTSRVLIGSVAAPVFVPDQTRDGGSASAGEAQQ